VLDLCRAFSGPLCAMMLGELGADVVKVENPTNPDETRTWPPFVGGKMSSYFSTLNRNKRSVALDLKAEAGRDAAHRLLDWADVIVENFTPGVTTRLGIDYETARRINPSVIYCSISGFGQDGPYRDRRGYDPVLQAMGGLMGVTGERGGGPIKTMIPIADYIAGTFAAVTILAALHRRDGSGQGEYVDLAMLDAMAAVTSTVGTAYLHDGKVPPRSGTENPTRVPSAAFECADGVYLQLVPNQRQWPRFCAAIELPELAEDDRFADNLGRIEHQDDLYPLLRKQFRSKPSEVWLETLLEAGIPVGPIHTLDALFRDPQIVHRDVVASLEHPVVGPMKAIRLPFRLQEAPSAIRRLPPAVGEHTIEALIECAGLTRDEVQALLAAGAASQTSEFL
jgi:formyl-CoA transferase